MEVCDCCGELVTHLCVVRRVTVLNGEQIITFDQMCARCMMKEHSLKE